MRRMLAAGAFAMLMVMLAACSGSSSKTVATSTTSTTAKPGTTTIADPSNALLTAQDLPTGWTTKPGSGTFYGYCDAPPPTENAAGARQAGGNFASGGEGGPVLSEQIFHFATEADAARFFATIRDSENACSSWNQAFLGQPVKITPSSLEFAALGDESTATRLSFLANDHTGTVDYAYSRTGPVVIGLALAGQATDASLESLMRTALARAGTGIGTP